MGNDLSVPSSSSLEDNVPNDDDDEFTDTMSVNRTPPRAPPLWKNKQFEIISPCSDISNPSRIFKPQQTPVRERRRTSKVMTKNDWNIQRNRTSLPPPGQFYFGAPLQQDQQTKPLVTYKNNKPKATHNHHATKQQATSLRTRAKAAISGCLSEIAAVNQQQQPKNKNQQLKKMMKPVPSVASSLSPSVDKKKHEKKDAPVERANAKYYPQFDPTIPSRDETAHAAAYLHSADTFFESLSSKHACESPVQKSPVMQLFEKDYRTKEQYETNDNRIRTLAFPLTATNEPQSINADRWLQAVLDIQRQSKEEHHNNKKTKHSIESTQTGPTRKSIESQIQQQIDEQIIAPTTVVDRILNASAVEMTIVRPEELRKSVESEIQQQINQQLERGRSREARRDSNQGAARTTTTAVQVPTTKIVHTNKDIIDETSGAGQSGRIHERRTQYKQEIDRLGRNKMQTSSSFEDSSSIIKVHSLRALYERSNSLPPSTKKESKALALKTRRSLSVPTRQVRVSTAQTNSFPVLLQLAGWQAPAVVAVAPKPKPVSSIVSKEKKFPALLKLAGWTAQIGNKKNKSHRLSVQSAKPRLEQNQRAKLITKTFRPSRASDPGPRAKADRGSLDAMKKSASMPMPITSNSQHIEVKATKPLRKETAASMPIEKRPASGVVTITRLLQETYMMSGGSDEIDEDEVSNNSNNNRGSAVQKGNQNSGLSLYSKQPEIRIVPISVSSPAYSLCSLDTQTTTDTRSPLPLVSLQAKSNANFLFSSPEERMVPPATAGPGRFAINTMASRIRLSESISKASSRAITIPARSSMAGTVSLDEPTRESSDSRRVRFSLTEDSSSSKHSELFRQNPTTVAFPVIVSGVSDLTDAGDYSHRASDVSAKVEPIPEEPSTIEEEDVSATETDDSECMDTFNELEEIQESAAKSTMTVLHHEDSIDLDERTAEATSTATPMVNPVMNWSYHSNSNGKNPIGLGVTPLRKGKSTSNATNSPFLRFKEARSRFSNPGTGAEVSSTKPSSPVKRAIGNLVTSRIAEMEINRHGAAESNGMQQSGRLPSTSSGNNDTSQARGTTVAAFSKYQRNATQLAVSSQNATHSVGDTGVEGRVSENFQSSPMLINGKPIDSPSQYTVDLVAGTLVDHATHSRGLASLHESEDSHDAFGEILQSYTFDDDSDGQSTQVQVKYNSEHKVASNTERVNSVDDKSEDDDDAFADILNDDDDESDDEESVEDATVSTVRQDKNPYLASSASSARFSVGGSTIASSATDSLSTFEQKRLSFASSSDTSFGLSSLPIFKEVAPVKPNEQNHRPFAGGRHPVLSPTQRTPVQAQKWRALAAAAQEKDKANKNKFVSGTNYKKTGRMSLSERNPNVGY
jgi:hypothetical protein